MRPPPSDRASLRHGLSAAVDVHYPPDGGANAAVVVAADPTFRNVLETRTVWVPTVAPYVPGRFFERELPPLLAVLSQVAALDLLIVDGYVTLDADGTPGLGAHVARSGAAPTVIGVAKTPFRSAAHAVEILRGASARPLHVTATGIDLGSAARLVTDLPGGGRIPDPLRLVDRIARSAPARA
ncbi:deoxyribonuclease V [Cellulosimicrobium cellulans]|uniref:endonuclease V n=1 Tax=Cellulosimicrobium cellulans TaxID=1710 RepID=UPI001956AE22|nr:endonuclease V [Cellulosimicrobium cellulans]MBM7819718.1 deoxyribonuclease V [Cellulosimicrobium cellulans]